MREYFENKIKQIKTLLECEYRRLRYAKTEKEKNICIDNILSFQNTLEFYEKELNTL